MMKLTTYLLLFLCTPIMYFFNIKEESNISIEHSSVKKLEDRIYQYGKPCVRKDNNLDSLDSSYYCFEYNFRDYYDKPITWRWSAKRQLLDSLSNNYGLPLNFFEPYRATRAMIARRKRIQEKGLFYISEGYLVPDYNAIVKTHAPVTKPLYELAKISVKDSNSLEEKIEILLRFCQDMKYRVPPAEYKDKIVEGLLPPSMSLGLGWGDVDTKAMIFASALYHEPDIKMIIFTMQNSVLVAIGGIHKPYQEYIEYKGEIYTICNTTGPARLNIGDRGRNFTTPQIITSIVTQTASNETN